MQFHRKRAGFVRHSLGLGLVVAGLFAGMGAAQAQAPEVLRNVVIPIQETLFGAVVVDPDAIRMLLFGIALVAVMIYRPEGLWPAKARQREAGHSKEPQA